jgi:cytochrome subunit of sulfide dehydrogenase
MSSFRVFAVATVLALTGTSAYTAEAPPGATSCTGCHPASRAVTVPVPRLHGRDAAQIVTAMTEFRAGQRPATVMDRIAKGFNDDETKAIAAWFAAQKD